MAQLAAGVWSLRNQLARSQGKVAALQAQRGPPSSEQGPAVPLPVPFDGDCQQFRGFMNWCSLPFLCHPHMYPSDGEGDEPTYRGSVGLDFAQDSLVLTNWDAFLLAFSAIFDDLC